MQKQFYQPNKLPPEIYQPNKWSNSRDPKNTRTKNVVQDSLIFKFVIFFVVYLLFI